MKPAFLHTDRRESFTTWRLRTLMNWYPMYFGTGGRILFWAADSQELHLRLRLSAWTYNLVGTIFGGSMFAAADPFYMVLLKRVLGDGFVVWDKSASIRFRKPGRQALYTKYMLDNELLAEIRRAVAEKGETERTFRIEWLDADGVLYAEMERVCYVAEAEFYKQKKGAGQRMRFK